MNLVVTGSSIIELLGLEVELSRRARQYAVSLNSHRPLRLFENYLEHGCWPFYKEDYFIQLSRVVNLIVEYDLTFLKESTSSRSEKSTSFWASWLKAGDFTIDERYAFEVGGAEKNSSRSLESAILTSPQMIWRLDLATKFHFGCLDCCIKIPAS